MTATASMPPVSQEYLEEYRGNTLLAICSTFIVLETLFVALRYYARYITTSGFGWDDAIIPGAWLTNIGLAILCITSVYDAGVGRHLAAVVAADPSKLAAWAKSLYALEWLYLTSVALPKMSILFLYLRIFTDRRARMTCYALLWIICATWVSFTIAFNLQCIPLAYQWDKTIPGGHCFHVDAYFKATSAPNIVTDVVILIVPIPTVINLQTTLVRKIGLLFVFVVGSVGLIGSCIRMATFFHHDAFTDNTWASVSLMGWSVIEPAMYLIAACLLTLRPILRKLSPKDLGSRLRNTAILRKLHNSKSDGSQESRRKSQLPRSSASGFVELHDKYDKSGAGGELPVPPKKANVDPLRRLYDVEQGFAAPIRHTGT